MAVDFLGGHGVDLIGGLADHIALKSHGLLVPLQNLAVSVVVSGIGVASHTVVRTQLHLGLEGLCRIHHTVGNIHLVLGHIDAAGNDLAGIIQHNRGNGGIHLCVGFF